MKIFRLLLAAVLTVLGLSGCLDIEKTVKLKADGSGTVEEKIVMSKATVAQMEQMAAGFGGLVEKKKEGKPAAKDFGLMDEKKLKEAAAKMGEGVTCVGAKKIETETGSGYLATYAFKDINTLKLDQNPGDSMPAPGGVRAPGGPGKSKVEPVTFQFAKGTPASLTVKMPVPELTPKKEKKEQPAGMETMAMQMMQQMFKDMKITMAVEVPGAITETNAEYQVGARVTLIEMDFNKLLANPEKFKQLAVENPKTLQESKALMKGIDGVKIETAPEVKIKFQ